MVSSLVSLAILLTTVSSLEEKTTDRETGYHPRTRRLVSNQLDDDGFNRGPGICVAYDVCTEDGLPCVANIASQPFGAGDGGTQETLNNVCPHLSSQDKLCCSAKQIETLNNEMRKASFLLSSCELCFTNFRALFCDIVCSPDQSMFVNITASAPVEGATDDTQKFVEKFTYFLSEEYADMVHGSCVDVSTMMCGNYWNSCTREDLYSYLGDNTYTTLVTEFVIGDGDISPFETASSDHLRHCYDFSTWDRCSCGDCSGTCDRESVGQDGLLHQKGYSISTTLATASPTVENSPTPTTLTQSCRSTISLLCPHYSDTTTLSCTETADLTSNIAWLNSIFGTCGNCHQNLQHLFCQYLFSADQSLFTNVKSTSGTSPSTITAIQLILNEDTVTSVYDSCRNVAKFQEFCKDITCNFETIMDSFFEGLLRPEIKLIKSLSPYDPRSLTDINFRACNFGYRGEGRCECGDCPRSCNFDDGYIHQPDTCLLVGRCESYFNVQNTTSFTLESDITTLLDGLCPLYDPGTVGCCDLDSLALLQGLLEPIKENAKCEVCSQNIARFFCELACSPHQSQSVEIALEEEYSWDNCMKAKNLMYFVTEETMVQLYTSCKDDHGVLQAVCADPSQCGDATSFTKQLGQNFIEVDNNPTTKIAISTDAIYSNVKMVEAESLKCDVGNPPAVESCGCLSCSGACETNADDGYFHGENVCLMYGTCKGSDDKDYPCIGNHPGKFFADEVKVTLSDICPTFEPGDVGCCNSDTINVMKSLLELASQMVDCPVCYHNLAKLFCNLFCHPDQSSFLMEANEDGNKLAVSRFRYYIDEAAGGELHESCKNDRSKLTQTLCGMKFERDCRDYKEFLESLGHNPATDFHIDFPWGGAAPAPFIRDKPVIAACNEPATGKACECEDCPAACNFNFDDGYVHKQGICIINTANIDNTNATHTQDSALLDSICPEMSEEHTVCCSIDDLNKLSDLLKAHEKEMGKCPACFSNVRRFMCHVACSSDQSAFTTLLITEEASQMNHFTDAKIYTKLYTSCQLYRGQESSEEDFVRDVLGKLIGGLYQKYTLVINENSYRGPDIQLTTVKGINNCYDEGNEKCTCKYCKETCESDSYTHSENLCLFYDICEGDFPCIKNVKPVQPDEGFRTKLIETCPQYSTSPVCCTHKQLDSFASRVSAVKTVIGSCPACYVNFVNVFCLMMCDPDQSSFLQVISEHHTEDTGKYSDQLRYHISEEFAVNLYDSCKNVKSGTTRAINLICDSTDCDLNNFYTSLGINKYTELQVFYERYAPESQTSDKYTPFNIRARSADTVHGCNDTVNGEKCSCADCPAVCEVVPPETHTNTDIYTIPIAIAIAILVTAGILVYAFYFQSTSSDAPDNSMIFQNPYMEDIIQEGGSEKDDKMEMEQQKQSIPKRIPDMIKFVFVKWSDVVYNHPVFVLLGCFVAISLCSIGLVYFRITTDPVELWTTPSSRSRLNKEFYEDTFGTPFRVGQLIFTEKLPGEGFDYSGQAYSSMFKKESMEVIYGIQKTLLSSVKGTVGDRTVSFADICYKPLGEHDKDNPINNCVVMSPFGWNYKKHKGLFFDDSELPTDSYLDLFETCGQLYLSPDCFGAYRGPIMTDTVFGGYNSTSESDTDFLASSTAIILTFVMTGEHEHQVDVLAWEAEFIKFMKEQKLEALRVSFSSDRALEDELERASHADVLTIIISYILMFAYVSTTLGKVGHGPAACCIKAKATIGLAGVVLVLVSVICSQGILSYFKLPATLVVIEVVPFLVLAVGVDNVYILVQSLQKKTSDRNKEAAYYTNDDNIKQLISDVLADVGPSMLMSSTCQTVAFSLGALSSMPAVQNFAWSAALAVFIDFLLQISAFVVVVTWDTRREFAMRADCVCCMWFSDETDIGHKLGPVRNFVENVLARLLFWPSKITRPLIVAFFACLTITSCALMTHMSIGLDESMALPSDSHLKDYYNDIFDYLNIGPTVSFVFRSSTKGEAMNIFDKDLHYQLIDSPNSLYKTMSSFAKDPQEDYITGSVGSWLTKFENDWLTAGVCCQHETKNASQFCPSSGLRDGCTECELVNNKDQDKYRYLKWYLTDIPEPDADKCVHGGKAEYGSSVKFSPLGMTVEAAYFTVSHPRLSGSDDFILSRRNALKLANEINKDNPLITVFPYSSYYHFYEQYDTIVRETGINLSICILATFLVSFVMLGFQIYPSLVILLSVTMITVDMMGVMVMVGIPLNAVALVNLIMSVGIAVEFSAHIVKSFTNSSCIGSRNRAKDALCRTGPSIFSGITLTKFVGIVVLAFAKSKLFEVFYFRMFLSVIVLGVIHSLIFLPALLSL